MDTVTVLFVNQPVEQLSWHGARVSSGVGCDHEYLLGMVCEAVVEEGARTRKYRGQEQRCLDNFGLVLRIYSDNVLVHNALRSLPELSQEGKNLGLLNRPLRGNRLGDIFCFRSDTVLLCQPLGNSLESWKLPLQKLET